MMEQQFLIEIALSLAVIPWCVWVTVSIFNQNKQIALFKQEVELVKEIKIAVMGPR